MEMVIWVATTVVFCATYDEFYRNYLEKKRGEWYFILLAWGLMAVFQLTVMWYVNGFGMTFLCNFTTTLCVVSFLFKGKISTKIVLILVSILLAGATEIIVAYFALMNGADIAAQDQIYVVLSNILYWAIVRISTFFIKGKIEEESKKTYGLVLGIILSINLFMEWFLVELNRIVKLQQIYYWCVLFSVLMLLLDIICFKVYLQLMNQRKIKRENELFARQLELCEAQMQERMAMMADVRRTRHDMKNQIIYVQNLLVNDEVPQAQQFLQEFMDTRLDSNVEISRSGNLVVDSILNNKYIIAKTKGIDMQADLQISPDMNYKASDICIVVGNLMENAIEAAAKIDTARKIIIRMKYVHQKLYIEIKNTYNGQYKNVKDGFIKTTKKDNLNHGIGLDSVKKVIDGYGGAIDIVADDEWFCVKVYL